MPQVISGFNIYKLRERTNYILLFTTLNVKIGGDYFCKVLRPNKDNEYETIETKTYTVHVFYTSSRKPSCEIFPSKPSYHEGDKIMFRCIADAGYPPVPIHFVSKEVADDANLPFENQRSYEECGNTILEFPVTLKHYMNRMSFDCIKQHYESLLSNQTCSFGSLQVLDRKKSVNVSDPDETSDGKPMHVIGGAVGGLITVIIIIIIMIVVVIQSKTPGNASSEQKLKETTPERDYLDDQAMFGESPSTMEIVSVNVIKQMPSVPSPGKEAYMDLDVSPRQQNTTYQGFANPDDFKTEDEYLRLDDASRQRSTTYQGLVNPSDLKTKDDYLRLDNASRKTETEYQSLKKVQNDESYHQIGDDDFYNEIPDVNTKSDRRVRVGCSDSPVG